MIISENYKQRLLTLSGLISENIKLTSISGRSDKGTLSWYVEEYILNLSSDIINNLDKQIEIEPGLDLFLVKNASNISSNSLTTKLITKGKLDNIDTEEEYILSTMVNFETSSNTTVSISNKGINNNFTLSSKHSVTDLETFKSNIVNYFMNSIKLNNTIKKD